MEEKYITNINTLFNCGSSLAFLKKLSLQKCSLIMYLCFCEFLCKVYNQIGS